MAMFELNIYGNNDEILKKFETNKVRWGVYMQAVELQEQFEDEEMTPAEEFSVINQFVKKIFPELTDADLENADGDDVINTFRQLLNKANKIKGGNPKNLKGAV